jgi:hypothetical protein
MGDHKSANARILYVGVALGFVALITAAAFYAPVAADILERWLVFVAASAFIFGYPIYDFWSYRQEMRFWVPICLMFICHFLFWVYCIRPHFRGDPRLLIGFVIMFVEYVVVSLVVKFVLRTGTGKITP